MPYNEEIDARISGLLSGRDTVKKKMFGGTCHLLQGNRLMPLPPHCRPSNSAPFNRVILGLADGVQSLEAVSINNFKTASRMAG